MKNEREQWLPEPSQWSPDESSQATMTLELCELEGAPVGPDMPEVDEHEAQPVSGNEVAQRRPLPVCRTVFMEF